MAQSIQEQGNQMPKPRSRAVTLDIGMYSYFYKGQQMCMLTLISSRGDMITFSTNPEPIVVQRQNWTNGLSNDAGQFIERIRAASMVSHVITERMVFKERNIRLGPYVMKGIGYQVAVILKAIRAAYVPEGAILLTLLSDWPKHYHEETLEILLAKGCQGFVTGLHM